VESVISVSATFKAEQSIITREMAASASDLNMKSLLEKVRRLEMENKNLKQRASVGEKTSITQKNVTIELPGSFQNVEKKPKQQSLNMGDGVTLIIHSMLSDNLNKITLWCEIRSTVEIDTTIIQSPNTSSTYNSYDYDDYGNKQVDKTFVDFLRVSEKSVVGTKHSVNITQRGYNDSSLTIGVTMIRMAQTDDLPCDNTTVTVLIQNQKLLVDVPYVSKWSQFLQGYFASDMKEKASGIYPINDCSLADFREMLDVIYPSSKPIDEMNVERMLDLADRFIMPMLTRKCEVFLSMNTSHSITEIRMIQIADRFNLTRTRTIVLERLGSTNLLRSKILKANGYKDLSHEMKREIDARYVQLDVIEREGNQNRGY
ncbi:hypothetical protein PMAYCL1PPCAC_30683, partial [Pristionchus mayeri]